MTLSLALSRPLTCTPHDPRPRRSLRFALTVWAERRALARMDLLRLTDLGISPIDAATEAARPFWDLPDQTCR